ncbi:MAG: prephenate dehydrogenase/arogenate dehydrogenase family protein [Burkholderiaceae bacterium]
MRLALIGTGLVGGSLAAAWREAGLVDEVLACDRDPAACASAVALGVADACTDSAAEAVRGADWVVLAVPVGAMAEVLAQIAPALRADAIVTDVGSTKASVIAAARAQLGAAFSRYVPAHPIAGGELPGVEHSNPGLFAGKLAITTPEVETDPAALETIEAAWRAIGSRVLRMSAADHDQVFAAVSHLPHLLAFALVARIAAEPDAQAKLGFAGAGFRDFTRIAASSPVMWRDICLANRVALSAELAGYRALLDEMQLALDQGDAPRLEATFDLASSTRRRFGAGWDSE